MSSPGSVPSIDIASTYGALLIGGKSGHFGELGLMSSSIFCDIVCFMIPSRYWPSFVSKLPRDPHGPGVHILCVLLTVCLTVTLNHDTPIDDSFPDDSRGMKALVREPFRWRSKTHMNFLGGPRVVFIGTITGPHSWLTWFPRLFDFVHLVLICQTEYHYLVTNWGNQQALLETTIPLDLHLILLTLASLTCQAFFLNRSVFFGHL